MTWDALETLVKRLAEQVGRDHDVLLAITRGGLVPSGMLAYLLGHRDILVAAVAYYDDHGQPGDQPAFLQFPSDPLLHGKRVLIVDEVWDTGTTIEAVVERVRLAGGAPTTAVLHYKPHRSKVHSVPDYHVVSTDAWVRLPLQVRPLAALEPRLRSLQRRSDPAERNHAEDPLMEPAERAWGARVEDDLLACKRAASGRLDLDHQAQIHPLAGRPLDLASRRSHSITVHSAMSDMPPSIVRSR